MARSTTSRRPGLYFEAVETVRERELPRMDVAAFVGFAAAGPIDVPVPVEDIAAFRDVFGPDLPLARDPETGRVERSFLGQAVEAFFANGGIRCWIVRVAGRDDESGPVPLVNELPLAGLLRPDGRLASVRARSAGGWSDELRAGAREVRSDLFGQEFDAAAGRWLTGRRDRPPIEGDLLRVRFGTVICLARVARVQLEEALWRAELETPADWFQIDRPLGSRRLVRLARAEVSGERALMSGVPEVSAAGAGIRIEFGSGPGVGLARGDLLNAQFDDGSTAWVRVDAGEVLADLGGVASSEGALWPLSAAAGLAEAAAWLGTPGRAPEVLRVEVALFCSHRGSGRASTSPLGLTDRHPRFFARLPSDEELHRPTALVESWWSSSTGARFALAGPSDPARWYLPLALEPFADPAMERGTSSAGSRFSRDGLTGLSAALFLDRRLAGDSSHTLAASASGVLARVEERGFEARLRGIHALWPIEEVSVLSAPDAVHRSWREQPARAPVEVGTPELTVLFDALGLPSGIAWTTIPGATRYRLERAEDPGFSVLTTAREGSATEYLLSEDPGCPRDLFFRVRAKIQGLDGGWSRSVRVRWPPRAFRPCAEDALEAPDLTDPVAGSPPGVHLLSWSDVGASAYEVEEASEPTFLDPTTIHRGGELQLEVPAGSTASRYFRVRATAPAIGPWSRTATLPGRTEAAAELEPAADYELSTRGELAAIHRGLMRFCAARRDATATLSVPAHYSTADAMGHRAGLADRAFSPSRLFVPPIGAQDPDWAYAALYHPWVLDEELSPPDGWAVGLLARRTLERGAWVAPANSRLRGVAALRPEISREQADALVLEGVNAIERTPRGMLPRTADTLDDRRPWRELSVVRISSLVHRAVRELANRLVFEPNGAELQTLARDEMERLFSRLWRLGALAGATPAQSFRVVTDRRLNRPEEVERGRFLAEIRYAPARPLEFLIIRLVERAPLGLVVEVA